MPHEPRTFPCMDDSPLNNGFYYRDESEMDCNFGRKIRTPRYPEDENEREDNEINYWSGFDGEVVGNNNGQFNCQNDENN